MKLNELFEAEVKHITFCFGRMNPPTIGHEQVLSTVASVGGDHKIFLSQTQDKKKNPLDYPTKVKFLKLMFPKFAGSVVEDASLNTIGKVCSSLYDQGYRHITLVAGSDRLEDMLKLIRDYNGIEGKAHGFYKFDTIDGSSSGDRDPDAEGVSGVSASTARAAAANGNLEEFNNATGAGQYAEELYNAVRKGMGIKDTTAKEGFMSFLKTEPTKKKWDPTKDSRVVSNKKDDDNWIKLLLDKHRRGIELTDREWHSIEQWKLNRAMKGEVKEGWKSKAAGAALAAANLLGSPAQAAEEPVKPITIAYVKIDGEVRQYNLGDKFSSGREAEQFISSVLDKQGLSGYTLYIKHGYPKKKEVKEAPIELDREDPMNPMIYGHDKANPAKLKYRMLRAAGQLKDLAARAENASPGEWQLMARQFDELKMNIEQIRHALEELSKIKSKGGIKSRGITV
jgi:hypothetical protein